MTVVKDTAYRLPLRLSARARVAVVVPRPEDLTPADTSSYLVPALAAAARRHHENLEEVVIPMAPSPREVRRLLAALTRYDLVILGTINAAAHAGQATLVRELSRKGVPTVAVALRLPYDLKAYPEVPTYVCAYGILPPSMDALADALWGRIPFRGHLPARLDIG